MSKTTELRDKSMGWLLPNKALLLFAFLIAHFQTFLVHADLLLYEVLQKNQLKPEHRAGNDFDFYSVVTAQMYKKSDPARLAKEVIDYLASEPFERSRDELENIKSHSAFFSSIKEDYNSSFDLNDFIDSAEDRRITQSSPPLLPLIALIQSRPLILITTYKGKVVNKDSFIIYPNEGSVSRLNPDLTLPDNALMLLASIDQVNNNKVWFGLTKAEYEFDGLNKGYPGKDKKQFSGFKATVSNGEYPTHYFSDFCKLVSTSFNNLDENTCLYMGLPNETRVAALTIDDAPSFTTYKILDLLDEQNIKATFFMIGANMVVHWDIASEILKRGHEIAHHMFGYAAGTKLSKQQFSIEFNWSDRLLKGAISELNRKLQGAYGEPVWFRPPSGLDNKYIRKIVSDNQYRSVLGNVGLVDAQSSWPFHGVSKALFKRQFGWHGSGGIALFHDSGDYRPAPWLNSEMRADRTVEILKSAMPEMIDQEQWTYLTLTDMLYLSELDKSEKLKVKEHSIAVADSIIWNTLEDIYSGINSNEFDSVNSTLKRILLEQDTEFMDVYFVDTSNLMEPKGYYLESLEDDWQLRSWEGELSSFISDTKPSLILFRTPLTRIGGRVVSRNDLPWYYIFIE